MPHLAPESKLWMYTASRDLLPEEQLEIQKSIDTFCTGWTAHNHQLKASGGILHHRLLWLAVDETQAGASGCSIDKSVHFLQKLGAALQTDFFSRTLVGIGQEQGNIRWVEMKEISGQLAAAELNAESPVIDTTLKTFGELNELMKPLKETWLRRYLRDHAA